METDDSVKSRTNPETRIQGFWPQGSNKPIVFINNIGEENVRHRGSNENAKAGIESKSNTSEARKAVRVLIMFHSFVLMLHHDIILLLIVCCCFICI